MTSAPKKGYLVHVGDRLLVGSEVWTVLSITRATERDITLVCDLGIYPIDSGQLVEWLGS